MASPVEAAMRIAQSEWAEEKRAAGGIVTVQGANGSYYHHDPGFAELVQRTSIPRNGFDMIPPAIAAEGAEAMQEFAGQPYTACFPFLTDTGGHRWVKLEGVWIDRLLVCAHWPEDDPAKQIVGSAPFKAES